MRSTFDVSSLGGEPDPLLTRLEIETLQAMSADWHAGRRVAAEEYLRRHPEVATQPDLAVRVVYEEVCLREELGEHVDSVEIYRRFPQWQHALEVLLDCHRFVQPEMSSEPFPEAPGQLGELELIREIDRGAVGRVLLATQPSLSDRPLVVKLTRRTGEEHLSLARLQHTHIVPLYLVQDFPAENLRALCMPYLGGTSWSRLLEDIKARSPRQRSGRQIVDLLAEVQMNSPLTPNPTGPALRFLERASYVQAVCWIGSCLADALHYAHQRGLLHLDIKPSNVLMAGDGQPMLLDFHLARQVVRAGSGPLERLGGTRGYMSPEQDHAAGLVRQGRPLDVDLDGRSDIYSLGVLMYESLAEALPSSYEVSSRRQLRELKGEVSRGLEDILMKCLTPDSSARYETAADLATDLRRHLADLPLSGVKNRSFQERWQKWRRRRPHAFAIVAMALAAASTVIVGGMLVVGDRLDEARDALAQGQHYVGNHDYAPAVERLEAGRDAIRWLAGHHDLKQALQTQLALARTAKLADALGGLVARLRFAHGFDHVPPARVSELQDACATVWRARTQIMQLGDSSPSHEVHNRLHIELLDLALLWADLNVRFASADQGDKARIEALALLDEAELLCGSSPILDLTRREYSQLSDARATPPALEPEQAPRTSWEHYAVGRSLFRADQFDEAQQQFNRALDLDASAFWPNFYLTLCAYRLEHFEEALNAASACVALSPKSAECFYNRALAHQALGHREAAAADFSRALTLDRKLSVAALHGGVLLGEMGRYAEALASLQEALSSGAVPAEVYYQVAVVHLARKNRSAALQSVDRALRHDDQYAPAVSLKKRLGESP